MTDDGGSCSQQCQTTECNCFAACDSDKVALCDRDRCVQQCECEYNSCVQACSCPGM
jgi:hypothetical protein